MENTHDTTVVVPTPFPNGNSVVGPNVLKYAERYQTLLNQTAESILALCETVYDAKKNLKPVEFTQFKAEVGLKSDATTCKFIAIGENVARLRPYATRLPHAWTTLYKLVRLPHDQFDAVAPLLCADTSTIEIDKALNIASMKKKKHDPELVIYFVNLNTETKKEVALELWAIKKKYGFLLIPSNDFSKEVGEVSVEPQQIPEYQS